MRSMSRPEGFIYSLELPNHFELVKGFDALRSLARWWLGRGDRTVLLEGFEGCIDPERESEGLIGFLLRTELRRQEYSERFESKALGLILTPSYDVDLLMSDSWRYQQLASAQELWQGDRRYASLVQEAIQDRIHSAWYSGNDFIRDYRDTYTRGNVRALDPVEEGHFRFHGIVKRVRNLSKLIA